MDIEHLARVLVRGQIEAGSLGQTLQQLRGDLTIIAISHQTALSKVADRSYRLQDGEAILLDNPEEIAPQSVDKDYEPAAFS
jgi:ABC-type transport system involved in cytochrome bd biosynthesis fused ATPase/permease subunit